MAVGHNHTLYLYAADNLKLASVHFVKSTEKILAGVRPPPQCLRIGVHKHNFVFDHILHLSEYLRVQLGYVSIHSASE